METRENTLYQSKKALKALIDAETALTYAEAEATTMQMPHYDLFRMKAREINVKLGELIVELYETRRSLI